MSTPRPPAFSWLRSVSRDPYRDQAQRDMIKALSPALTGQDLQVLLAIDACWQAYPFCDEVGRLGCLAAVRALLPGMQQQCWPLARELIARALDWGDRARLWPLVVPPAPAEPPLKVCGCGASYDVEAWKELKLRGPMGDGVEQLELRDCSHCGSTIAITLPPAPPAGGAK